MEDGDRNALIIGAGIIGCSIAYHLTELGTRCTVLERCSVACGASGKAGGFLARTWNDLGPAGLMARESFELHRKYGAMFDCDYRPVDTLKVAINEGNRRKSSASSLPAWLDGENVTNSQVIGTTSNTAQVHSGKLTKCFLAEAQKKGCQLMIGNAVGLRFSEENDKRITGVKLEDGRTVACDILILAMGPWTNNASPWFQYSLPSIGAQRAHSIILKPSEPVSAHALFLEYRTSKGTTLDPEVYPRPDGTVYVCGFSDFEPLPASADKVKPSEESVKTLKNMISGISSTLRDSRLLTEQACYLPLPPQDAPLIGAVPGFEKVYIAAGHSCWGILNAPATGKAIAELITYGHSDLDLSPFDPRNFM